MEMRVPEVIAGKDADCQVRGFNKEPGDLIEVGEYLGELRVEYDDGDFTDCPVLYYGDLVARERGVLVESRAEKISKQGDVLAIVGEEPGGFSIEFVTF
ncbi:MAG: hypothetical protein CME06_12725 [Gemmatimonadetes bacterium]|nr:hypothetical protein [Gemmatimonadota bacterium]